jgi:hypothetical protein
MYNSQEKELEIKRLQTVISGWQQSQTPAKVAARLREILDEIKTATPADSDSRYEDLSARLQTEADERLKHADAISAAIEAADSHRNFNAKENLEKTIQAFSKDLNDMNWDIAIEYGSAEREARAHEAGVLEGLELNGQTQIVARALENGFDAAMDVANRAWQPLCDEICREHVYETRVRQYHAASIAHDRIRNGTYNPDPNDPHSLTQRGIEYGRWFARHSAADFLPPDGRLADMRPNDSPEYAMYAVKTYRTGDTPGYFFEGVRQGIYDSQNEPKLPPPRNPYEQEVRSVPVNLPDWTSRFLEYYLPRHNPRRHVNVKHHPDEPAAPAPSETHTTPPSDTQTPGPSGRQTPIAPGGSAEKG